MGVAQEKMDYHRRFIGERKRDISQMVRDEKITELGRLFIKETLKYKYSLNFKWLGRPIIQLPQDIIAVQEIIWEVKPDLIIETGIAHGGSLIFHASMLELIDGDGIVLGIDIDIRKHNRLEIEKHSMFKRIRMIEGSSVDQPTVDQVHDFTEGRSRILVILDSNHTHDHVLRELELYSPLVTKGSYLIVLDTVIEDLPEGSFPDRPWGRGNNPRTAVWEFLKTNGRFEIDRNIQNKLVITSAPDGYLKCIKEREG
jgi:cephalosporin hydroxylase